MAITKLNRYRGETITFRFIGDDTYQFDNDHPFILLLYPDGMDISQEANRKYVRIINSKTQLEDWNKIKEEWQDNNSTNANSAESTEDNVSSTATVVNIPVNNAGYIEYPEGETNTVLCRLPWQSTQNMQIGSYTVELLYGDDVRSVITRNSAFTIVAALSEQINSSYELSNK